MAQCCEAAEGALPKAGTQESFMEAEASKLDWKDTHGLRRRRGDTGT